MIDVFSNKEIFFGREKSQKFTPHVFLKYVLKSGVGMRYTRLTDYAPIFPRSDLSPIGGKQGLAAH